MMAWILSASVCAIMYLEGGVSGNVRSPRGKLRGAPPQGGGFMPARVRAPERDTVERPEQARARRSDGRGAGAVVPA
jgi:hypothetical protein